MGQLKLTVEEASALEEDRMTPEQLFELIKHGQEWDESHLGL
jgi:hypothetical protein